MCQNQMYSTLLKYLYLILNYFNNCKIFIMVFMATEIKYKDL